MQLDTDSLKEFFTAKKLDVSIARSEYKQPLQRFWLKLGPKCDIAKLEKVDVDIGLQMRVLPPVITPDFTSGEVCLEFMTDKHPVVKFDELAKSSKFEDFETLKGKYELPVLLGTTDVDQPLIVDLASFPHLLLAGTTGSGKSISEHCIIQSLKMHAKANRVRIIPMDPKYVEFHDYEDDPCLFYESPGIATTPEVIEERVSDLTAVMDKRLKLLKQHGCRDLKEFRRKNPKHGTYLVVVIDELADLMRTTKGRFEKALDRLAAKSRAAGIYLVAATQYPHSKVITSTIKANFDGRICFKVAESTQSRVMLANNGAEKLQGKGDGLISGADFTMQRFQGALISSVQHESSPANKIKSFFAGKIA